MSSRQHLFRHSTNWPDLRLLIPLVAVLVQAACSGSRISGTYVARDTNEVAMLELTQTKDEQITGSLNWIELSSDGSIHPQQESITGGTLDGDQLTLKFGSALGATLTGTLKWNTIRLHSIGQNGDFQAAELHRGSPEAFKRYAEELKRRGQSIVMTSQASKQIPQIRQRIQAAEAWISEAELHAGRIPGAKDHYRSIEKKHASARQVRACNVGGVARGQLVVQLNQGTSPATKRIWKLTRCGTSKLAMRGPRLHREFAGLNNCPAKDESPKAWSTGRGGGRLEKRLPTSNCRNGQIRTRVQADFGRARRPQELFRRKRNNAVKHWRMRLHGFGSGSSGIPLMLCLLMAAFAHQQIRPREAE